MQKKKQWKTDAPSIPFAVRWHRVGLSLCWLFGNKIVEFRVTNYHLRFGKKAIGICPFRSNFSRTTETAHKQWHTSSETFHKHSMWCVQCDSVSHLANDFCSRKKIPNRIDSSHNMLRSLSQAINYFREIYLRRAFGVRAKTVPTSLSIQSFCEWISLLRGWCVWIDVRHPMSWSRISRNANIATRWAWCDLIHSLSTKYTVALGINEVTRPSVRRREKIEMATECLRAICRSTFV